MPTHPALTPMAPLDGLAVAEVVLEVPVVLEAEDAVKEGVDVELAVPEDVGTPRGAVDCPAICDWIAEEKLPVILSRVNLAEKA
jgi:hypothetical protein